MNFTPRETLRWVEREAMTSVHPRHFVLSLGTIYSGAADYSWQD